MHKLRGWVLGSALLAVGLLISGCSSGSGTASPSPEVSVSSTDGSLVVGEGSKLPDSWPPDVAAPSGLALQSVIDSGDSAVALYLGPGDAVAAGSDVKSKMLANGYDLQTDSTQGPARVTTYLKDTTQVQVSVEQTGSDASVTVTVVRLA